ncbi:MAG TPA: hypothetical protein VFL57_22585 [Bryobacteraceae bacterium]|nr:hypothetical protein [Bryobacteraceae bacterium]
MSKYRIAPFDFTPLKTVPLAARGGKVRVEHFARPVKRGEGVLGLIDSLPRILAGDSFRAVTAALLAAREANKQIVWGMGGHVIKSGLAPVLLDLMQRGFATAFAMNGSAAIHDFEIAVAGETSEDVEAVLPDGRFGAAEETGRELAAAVGGGAHDRIGLGEAIGRHLDSVANAEFAATSLLLGAWRVGTPVTVHVAIGTDTPHTWPKLDAAALGTVTHHDFRLFCSLIAALNGGGVYLNLGSAVVMPEVFLKAVSVVRNVGQPLRDFTTVNFDFLQHYRPRVNVIERPHANAGGRGYSITGHHELMIPLLAAALVECDA